MAIPELMEDDAQFELAKRIFTLGRSFLLINQFVESRSQFQNGLVNHAFSAALRALLLVCFSELITRPWWHNSSTNFSLGDFIFKDCGSIVSVEFCSNLGLLILVPSYNR